MYELENSNRNDNVQGETYMYDVCFALDNISTVQLKIVKRYVKLK